MLKLRNKKLLSYLMLILALIGIVILIFSAFSLVGANEYVAMPDAKPLRDFFYLGFGLIGAAILVFMILVGS